MDEQNGVYPWGGMSLGLERAPLWMDFEDLRPRGISQTQKTNIVRFRSCEVSGMVGVLETDAGQRRK